MADGAPIFLILIYPSISDFRQKWVGEKWVVILACRYIVVDINRY